MPTSIALRVSDSDELFFIDIGKSRFCEENSVKCCIESFSRSEDTSWKPEKMIFCYAGSCFDSYHTEISFINREDNDVERKNRNRETPDVFGVFLLNLFLVHML